MKRYVIINEYPVEISEKDYAKYGNVTDAFLLKGVKNGSYSEIAIFDFFEKAKAELLKYKTVYKETSGFANSKFFTADIYYICEQEYDNEYDQWEDTGDYEFAKEN